MKTYGKIALFSLALLAVGCGPDASVGIFDKQTALPEPNVLPAYNYTHKLSVGNQNLMVELANNPETMAKGLSDRISMANNQGMLFDFGDGVSASPAFWMKDMKFNLDLIWIQNKKIIGITPDVPKPDVTCHSSPVTCLPTYYPPSPINWVLEVNAGWVAKNGIKVGDEIRLINYSN